tara:strand:+ start:186 stop:533 length:348 start_codon:yes stop_codon:yes gene_type:complete
MDQLYNFLFLLDHHYLLVNQLCFHQLLLLHHHHHLREVQQFLGDKVLVPPYVHNHLGFPVVDLLVAYYLNLLILDRLMNNLLHLQNHHRVLLDLVDHYLLLHLHHLLMLYLKKLN